MRTCFISVDVEKKENQEKQPFEGVEKLDNILNIFEKYNVKATLFITGEVLERYPDLIKKWARDYEISCHNFLHIDLDKLDFIERERQIRRFVKIYEGIFGVLPKGFRAPRNIIDNKQFEILQRYNFLYDSSVVPRHIFLHKYKGYKGWAPKRPYFPSVKNYRKKGDFKILEIPVTPLFGGIPFAATWIRRLGIGFFKILPFIKKPKFLALTMHSWDGVEFPGGKNSGEKFLRQLDELLGFLKKAGYEFKSGEQILHDANLRI